MAAALLLGLASCATTPEPPAAPRLISASNLPDIDGEWKTLRGLARVRLEGPIGSGSAGQAVLVALPDAGRLEGLSPLGTTMAVLVVAGDEVRYHSAARREYAAGRATQRAMERLLGIPVPPGPLLRMLAGLPPLPIRMRDPRTRIAAEGDRQALESVDGGLWQRIQFPGAQTAEPARGELGDAGGTLLTFEWEAWRTVGDVVFPHTVRMAGVGRPSRIEVRYEWVRLGEALDPSLFLLPRPAGPDLRVLDLGEEGPVFRPVP
jgi:hypothetical protein